MPLEAIAQELLESTDASRVTIRLDDVDGLRFPVKAEALAGDAGSLLGRGLGAPNSGVVQFLIDEKRILVQRDVLVDEPTAEGAFELYGVRAQILAPLLRDGELHGFVSVHGVAEPRVWSDDDIAALERAVAKIEQECDGLDSTQPG